MADEIPANVSDLLKVTASKTDAIEQHRQAMAQVAAEIAAARAVPQVTGGGSKA